MVAIEIDPSDIGLAGALQLFRIDSTVQHVRRGEIIDTTHSVRFGFTSLAADEASPPELLEEFRSYWGIENRQHYCRDVAQNEDKCGVRRTRRAQNISLLRSWVGFVYRERKKRRGAPVSLPRFHTRNHRQPRWAIGRVMGSACGDEPE